MKDTQKVVLGVLAGAVAGAVTALLVAPQSGTETRRYLRRTTDKFRGDISDTVQQGIDRLNSLRGRVTGSGEDSDVPVTRTSSRSSEGGSNYGGTSGGSYGSTGSAGTGTSGATGNATGSSGSTGNSGSTGSSGSRGGSSSL